MLGDIKDSEEDQKIRWKLIDLVKQHKIDESNELVNTSYLKRPEKQIELKYFYDAVKLNNFIREDVKPSTREEQVIKYMRI